MWQEALNRKATCAHDGKKEGAREAVCEVISEDPPCLREMKILSGKQNM